MKRWHFGATLYELPLNTHGLSRDYHVNVIQIHAQAKHFYNLIRLWWRIGLGGVAQCCRKTTDFFARSVMRRASRTCETRQIAPDILSQCL
jgi:hypothetical protein